MGENEIRKYAGLMRELGLTGLEITENDRVVRLERTPPAQTAAVPMTEPSASGKPEPGPDPDVLVVRSPLVGVFYAAPAENAEAFVSVGDRVKRGQVLCIVEAMKLMNEVTAEQSGTITAVCVDNGQVVEYGQTLFMIK